jgi:hypothetical protein
LEANRDVVWVREQRSALRIGSTSIAALLSIVIVVAPLAESSQSFKRTFKAPFAGTFALTNSLYSWGSSYSSSNQTSFNLSTGFGTFSSSAWGNSTNLVKNPYGFSIYSSSVSRGGSDLSARIVIPFHNMSGTRSLTSINVTVKFAISGNFTFSPGTCPWVRATHHKNQCISGGSAAASIEPESMTYLKGYGPITYGVCAYSTTGCSGNGAGAVFGAVNYSTNNSTGLTSPSYSSGSVGPTSFSTTGKMSMLFTPLVPITKNHTLVIWFEAGCRTDVGFEALTGRGGLSGSYASASITLSMALISLVET